MRDSPTDLHLVGTIWDSDPMPADEAQAKFERITYAEAMAEVGHENEAVNLSLELPDENGIGICQHARTLYPASDLPPAPTHR